LAAVATAFAAGLASSMFVSAKRGSPAAMEPVKASAAQPVHPLARRILAAHYFELAARKRAAKQRQRSRALNLTARKLNSALGQTLQNALVSALTAREIQQHADESGPAMHPAGRSPSRAEAQETAAQMPTPRRGPRPRSWWGLLKTTFADWQEDKVPRLGAALAYYTMFSLAPLIVIAIAVAGLIFGEQAVQGRFQEQLSGVLGNEAAQGVQALVASAQKPELGSIAAIIGVVVLLFGASGVFGELQDALNTIWEVKPKPGRGVWGIIRDRFLSFSMVMGVCFLLLVSLVISTGVAAVQQAVGNNMELSEPAAHALNFVITFGIITLLFAMIFKILPDVEIGWRDVWLGAVVTALLFTIGKLLIGLYLGHAAVSSSYGAAGSVVVVLIWTYYSAQILYLGAEFTQVYARTYGSRIRPSANALPVTAESRVQQGLTPSKA